MSSICFSISATVSAVVFSLVAELFEAPDDEPAPETPPPPEAPLAAGLLFVSSIFCGMMIYIGVEYYKRHSSFLGILFAIPIFVICGFDHAVADTFYYSIVGQYDIKDLILLAIVVIGNIIGSNLVRFIFSH